MPKGRPRKHAKMHMLDGTSRPARHDCGADAVEAKGQCLPTRKLSRNADHFFNVVLNAYPPGTLGESDSESLTRCAELVAAHFVIAAEYATGTLTVGAYLRLTAESNRQYLQFAVRFGLTPADKGKVKLTGLPEGEAKDAKFFGVIG